MGEYYVKELSRSEGFELSVGNKLHAVTNLGQDLEAAVLEPGEGYAHISMQMYGEEAMAALIRMKFSFRQSRRTRKMEFMRLWCQGCRRA